MANNRISRHTLRHGGSLEYDQSKVLPPDYTSETMGMEAARVLRTCEYLQTMSGSSGNTTPKTLSMAVLGCGSGIEIVAALHRLAKRDCLPEKPVKIIAFDINPDAVSTTTKNAGNALRELPILQGLVDLRIFSGDWSEPSTWHTLDSYTDGSLEISVANPPYLPFDTPLLKGYENVPHEAVYGDQDGATHYRSIVPELLRRIGAVGSSIILRSSSGTNQMVQNNVISGLVAEYYKSSDSPLPLVMTQTYLDLGRANNGRNCSRTIISHTLGPNFLQPHCDPMVTEPMDRAREQGIREAGV